MTTTTTPTTAAVLAEAAPAIARAVRWAPLAGASTVLVLAALAVGASDRPADLLAGVAAAALASLLVASLHDPAQDLLAPVPVSAMQRRLLRLGLVGGPVLAVWAGLVLLAGTSSATTWTGSLLALSATGVAAAVWTGPGRGVAVGAAVPVLWFALDQVLPAGPVADAVAVWRTDPWYVVAAAVAACALGRNR